ncbi:MAG TPA: lysylphosphatidylglycerol synthase transmembrane domain-containing protein [Candidatus Saccharimonadales bacterium]|nr:lysylphosphatidylglycerol synthase transmembrane domain-containing protein [Candidatus Saccharimonadales bacterium]
MNKRLRLVISVVLTLLTVAVFAYYLDHHSYLLTKLRHTRPLVVVWLLFLYVLWFSALALILQASARVCGKRLPTGENFLLNAYSSLVNFFIPGQGGPAVRAVYLKQKYKIRVRSYIFATLIYYACYALVSGLMLLTGSRPWWQTLLATIAIGGLSCLVLFIYHSRSKMKEGEVAINWSTLSYVGLATVLQAIIQVAIYFSELHSVNSHISLHQAITYTGAANFALFVALTPGAIGIRESFLIFSEKLHHITSANIVAANVIDRAIFIVFLGGLFLLVLGFHAKEKLHIKPTESPGS